MLTLLSGCATTTPTRLPCPLTTGQRWTRTSTQHFDVVSDRPPAAVQSMARDLEQTYETMVALPDFAVPLAHPPIGRFLVLATSRDEDYAALGPPEDSIGFFAVERFVGEDPLRLIALRSYFRGRARETVLHELTHLLVNEGMRGAPLWVNEGLATYLSTLHWEGPRVVVGDRPAGYRGSVWLGKLEEVMACRSSTECYQVENFHLRAWALVHLLQQVPEHRRLFRRYLELLRDGLLHEAAYAQTLATLPWPQLSKEYGDYLLRGSANSWTIPWQPPTVSLAPSVALDHVGVHQTFASLLRGGDDKLVHELTELEALAPNAIGTLRLKARLALGRQPFDVHVALLQDLMARFPEERRFPMASYLYQHKLRRPIEPSLRALMPRLEQLAPSAMSLAILAAARLLLGEQEGALEAAEAACQLERGNRAMQELRARALLGLGRDADAAAAVERALAATAHAAADETKEHALARLRAGLGPQTPPTEETGTEEDRAALVAARPQIDACWLNPRRHGRALLRIAVARDGSVRVEPLERTFEAPIECLVTAIRAVSWKPRAAPTVMQHLIARFDRRDVEQALFGP